MKKKLTLEERFEWLKENPPSSYKKEFGWSWRENVECNIIRDMYSYTFNHNYYTEVIMTDDEARHKLLDEINVPRYI